MLVSLEPARLVVEYWVRSYSVIEKRKDID
jgi:hypothetical protein